MLQIGHLLDRKPSQLSGGQRQRVAMGRALVRDPQVFLFDEPLSNLDAKLRVDMRTEIKRLHQRMGTTIVYVTHDQIEAMTLATKIAVLQGRRAAAVRHAGRDLQQPGQHVRRRLHGLAGDEPDPGAPSSKAATACASRWRAAQGEPLTLPLAGASTALSRHAGREVIFGIRPEALTDPDGADRNAHSIAERRMPDRSGRAGGLRHLRRHPSRRQGGRRAAARRRQHPAGPGGAARLQSRQGGVLRPGRAESRLA